MGWEMSKWTQPVLEKKQFKIFVKIDFQPMYLFPAVGIILSLKLVPLFLNLSDGLYDLSSCSHQGISFLCSDKSSTWNLSDI